MGSVGLKLRVWLLGLNVGITEEWPRRGGTVAMAQPGHVPNLSHCTVNNNRCEPRKQRPSTLEWQVRLALSYLETTWAQELLSVAGPDMKRLVVQWQGSLAKELEASDRHLAARDAWQAAANALDVAEAAAAAAEAGGGAQAAAWHAVEQAGARKLDAWKAVQWMREDKRVRRRELNAARERMETAWLSFWAPRVSSESAHAPDPKRFRVGPRRRG